MNQELNPNLIGLPQSPIRAIKSKAEKSHLLKEIQSSSDWQALRICLIVGKQPEARLITPEIINAALPPSDRWKHARHLVTKTTTVDASALLKSLEGVLHQEPVPSLKQWAKSLLRLLGLWEGKQSDLRPSQGSVDKFLAITARVLELGVHDPKRSKSLHEPALERLILAGLEMALRQPSPVSLSAAGRIVAAALTKLGWSPSEDKSDSFDTSVEHLWQVMIADATSALREVRLDDARSLLTALKNFPGKTAQFQEFLVQQQEAMPALDAACLKLISELLGHASETAPAVTYAEEIHVDIQWRELGRIMLRAADAAAGTASAQELAEELLETMGRLFGLHLFGEPGQRTEYDPRVHEFAPDSPVATTVQLVRPGICLRDVAGTSTIFRAMVRAQEGSQ